MPWLAWHQGPTIFYERDRANASLADVGKTDEKGERRMAGAHHFLLRRKVTKCVIFIAFSARNKAMQIACPRCTCMAEQIRENNHEECAVAARLHLDRTGGGRPDHRHSCGDRDERLWQLHNTQQG